MTKQALHILAIAGVLASTSSSMLESGEGVFNGTYSDPNHPDCARYILQVNSTYAEVSGYDAAGGEGVACDGETDEPWGPLPGSVSGDSISVDFSSKGGPSDLSGSYNTTSNGIDWEDGNVWSKVSSGNIRSSSYNSTCSGPVQDSLKYNVSTFTAQSVGLPGNPPADESLTEAICCDSQYKGYPEPRGLYADPSVRLFEHMDKSSVNVFYDPVCGIPLFKAPMNRSFESWYSESREHGWPSFRTAEVVMGNVIIESDGVTVVSACGTKLGTNEADSEGDRYCMDLVCIAGNEES